MSLDQKAYWENAGRIGYQEAMFRSRSVAQHVNHRLLQIALEFGWQLGLGPQSRILDLGCGDGSFSNEMLAPLFAAIDGIDVSEAGVQRAQANAPGQHVNFRARDITKLGPDEFQGYDGAFLIGILHHVKPSAPAVVRALSAGIPRVVVLEPNGNHVLRRLLEWTPTYRAAGEASFSTRRVRTMFEQAGYRCVNWRRLNLFPNFTPERLFRLFGPLEPIIEKTSVLRALCTVNMYGFRLADGPSNEP